MAFSGQQLTLSGSPDELIPVISPTGGEPTAVTTIVNGGTIMTATSSGVAVTQIGPAAKVNTPVTFGMSPYTVLAADVVLMCATSGGAISVVLPTAASSTNRVIQVVDATGNAAGSNITITVSGGGLINGSASYVINLAYGTATFFSTGAFWVVTDKIASSGGGGGYATGVRQVVYATLGTQTFSGSNIPFDNTIPQITEGFQILTASITPQSATSTLYIWATVNVSCSSIASAILAIFRDATVNAFGVSATAVLTANTAENETVMVTIPSGSTAASTIRLRGGANSGNLYINGNAASGQTFGGASATSLLVMEVGV